MEKFPAGLVRPLVSMRPEVVALSLNDVCGRLRRTERVELGKRRGRAGNRQRGEHRPRNHPAPGKRFFAYGLGEIIRENYIFKFRLRVESRRDSVQKHGAYYAA